MKHLIFISFLALILSACATQQGTGAPNNNENAAMGAVIGAIAGAVAGNRVDDHDRRRGTLIGAIAGAAAGAGIGQHMDNQQQEFENALEEEKQRSQIKIERVRDDLLKLTFDSTVTFDSNSSLIKPSFRASLGKVSDILDKYQSQAQIVGHTDSIGTHAYNQTLSEERALSVKIYFLENAVPTSQLSASGRGESEPVASNMSEAGRQLNRRVELLIKPSAHLQQ